MGFGMGFGMGLWLWRVERVDLSLPCLFVGGC